MRLLLLPINSRNTLIYAQRLNQQLIGKQTRLEKITAKASERWLLWESYKSGWQKKVTVWGNQLFARIPYQEWGLKSIPPLSARRQQDELQGKDKVEVLFPASTLPESKIPDVLRKNAVEKQAFHRQRMIWTIIGLPFTIPFALLPVIPNLPFFYMAFRAWSHWKALSGSKHIAYLLDNQLLVYTKSSILQKIYDIKELPNDVLESVKTRISSTSSTEDRTQLFSKELEAQTSQLQKQSSDADALYITKSTGHLISLCFDVPQVDAELERAVMQVKKQTSDNNTKVMQDQTEKPDLENKK